MTEPPCVLPTGFAPFGGESRSPGWDAVRRLGGVRGGFIHIPYAPAQAAHPPGAPSLAIETVAAGLRTALDTRVDRRRASGAEH